MITSVTISHNWTGKKKQKKEEALIVSCKKLTQVNKKEFLLGVGRKRP
jgi:hypothetical protein